MPHESARGSWSPNARAVGPWTPRTTAGRLREGEPGRDAEVAAGEELDADREEGDAEDPDERERRPVVDADERARGRTSR